MARALRKGVCERRTDAGSLPGLPRQTPRLTWRRGSCVRDDGSLATERERETARVLAVSSLPPRVSLAAGAGRGAAGGEGKATDSRFLEF